jgi:hypothetical protein
MAENEQQSKKIPNLKVIPSKTVPNEQPHYNKIEPVHMDEKKKLKL